MSDQSASTGRPYDHRRPDHGPVSGGNGGTVVSDGEGIPEESTVESTQFNSHACQTEQSTELGTNNPGLELVQGPQNISDQSESSEGCGDRGGEDHSAGSVNIGGNGQPIVSDCGEITEEPTGDSTQVNSNAVRKVEWLNAIRNKDCLSLVNILDGLKEPALCASLCLERGEEGRTALHVAAMQGCFRLAKQVIDLVHQILSENIAMEYMDAKDDRSGLAAFEMANDIIGNTSISQYILYVRMEPEENEDYDEMYEAYEGTEWHTALAKGNCSELREFQLPSLA